MEQPQQDSQPPAQTEQQPKQPTKMPSRPSSYRISWPVIFIIVLLIAAGVGAWAYFGNVKLSGVASSKEEQLKTAQVQVAALTKERDKAKADLVAHKAQDTMDAQYVTISEWGVKFKPGADLPDSVNYIVDGTKADPPNANIATAYFTSRSLLATAQPIIGLNTDNTCNIHNGPLGMIERFKSSADLPKVDGPTKQKQIGQYIYGYFHTLNVVCAPNATVNAVITKQATALQNAFDSLVAAQ